MLDPPIGASPTTTKVSIGISDTSGGLAHLLEDRRPLGWLEQLDQSKIALAQVLAEAIFTFPSSNHLGAHASVGKNATDKKRPMELVAGGRRRW